MKALVTGGAGYIGSLLVPMLLQRSYKVSLLDQFIWGVKPVLHFASDPNLEIVKGDIRDAALVSDLVSGHDLIIHLAAIVGYPACAADRDRAVAVNVDGTRNVVDSLSSSQQLVFASTGSTYGKVEGICTEDNPIDPLTLYGSTKWEAEKLVTDAGGIALRFATVFGLSPRLRLDLLVNDFTYQAVHSRQIILYEGHFRRTFLHCKDAARSYLTAIDNYSKMSGEAFNVGDNNMNFTKRDVAQAVKRHVDFYLHEADVGKDLDQRDYEVSYDKITRFGFRAEVDIDQGICELLKVIPHIQITNEWRNA